MIEFVLSRTSLGCVSFAVLLALGACSTTIDANDYDRSCTEDSDCVIISVGDICSCSCEIDAINKSDLEAYNHDRDVDCGVQCGACAGGEPVCQSGVCGVDQ